MPEVDDYSWVCQDCGMTLDQSDKSTHPEKCSRVQSYALTCEACGVLSPIVTDEDEVVDVAQDAGWTVTGCNEDAYDLCPACQITANPGLV